MSAARPHPPRDFHVEFSPKAWQQIGSLSWDTFNRLQQALNAAAAQVNESPGPIATGKRLSLEVDNWLLIYELQEPRRVVMLLEMSRK